MEPAMLEVPKMEPLGELPGMQDPGTTGKRRQRPRKVAAERTRRRRPRRQQRQTQRIVGPEPQGGNDRGCDQRDGWGQQRNSGDKAMQAPTKDGGLRKTTLAYMKGGTKEKKGGG